MADVNIKYKGKTIAEMDSSGSKTLHTGGSYCEADIVVEYATRETVEAKRWDVTVDGTIVDNGVVLVTDDWLKEHRQDENLCIVVVPKFTIAPNSEVGNQGVYLCTNSPLISDSDGTVYKGLSAFVNRTGSISTSARSVGVESYAGTNIGDVWISVNGVLHVVALDSHPLAPGEYTVVAFLL